MKSQLVTSEYIFFLDDLELYQTNPYKLLGGAEALAGLPVKSWIRVNVTTGEDVDELGYGSVSSDERGRWYAVGGSFPKDETFPALIGSRNKNYYA